jgi:TIR domain
MAKPKRTCDVFISHAAGDVTFAQEVANACRASGLDAVTVTDLLPGKNPGDALWDALAESRALLTILSPTGPTPSMAIEIGAARAWNKPIYGVVTDPSATRLPPALSGVHLYTIGRIQDIINAIELVDQEFSDDDRSFLIRLYSELGVSVEQLALNLDELGELVRKFKESRGKSVSGERLLSELFRLRKRGRLFLKRPGGRPRSHSGSA